MSHSLHSARRSAKSSRAGFTLIELLVVVLIIGILSAIALPQYNKSVYRSRMKEVEVLLAAMHQARLVYEMETGNKVPQRFSDLAVGLPDSCKGGISLDPSTTDGLDCGNYNIYTATGTTLATVYKMGSCDYCHFDKLYPSGKMRCRESNPKSDFYRYCKDMGYTVSNP